MRENVTNLEKEMFHERGNFIVNYRFHSEFNARKETGICIAENFLIDSRRINLYIFEIFFLFIY